MTDSGDAPVRREFRSRIRDLPDLERLLWSLLRQIPDGSVTTYGDLADALGDRIASRWVGHRLRNHDANPENCVCHRVVRAGGELGGYAHGSNHDKVRQLAHDNIETVNGYVADFSRRRFKHFRSNRPLEELKQLQNEIVACVVDERLELTRPCRRVAGVDVSYAGSTAVATCCLFEFGANRVGRFAVRRENGGSNPRQVCVERAVRFPYISTYLSFRELPPMMDAVQELGERADFDVLLVDGSGILHPRRAGVATLLGIALDVPTIGVTKKHLAGRYDERSLCFGKPTPVFVDEDRCQGYAILPTESATKPLFVSPGHRVGVIDATETVIGCLDGHRLPEPLFFADRESRRAARELQKVSAHDGQSERR